MISTFQRLLVMELKSLLLITLSIAGTTLGGSFLTRRDFEEHPRASLQFAVRSIELGLNPEKQDDLRKRGFALREEHECESCPAPKLPDGTNPCEYGFTPFIQNVGGSDCSCISEYKCCDPPPCAKLTDDDWKKCENETTYGVGKYFPMASEDCCDCPVVKCILCPQIILSQPPADWGTNRRNTTHQYFWCENECDVPVLGEQANKCPMYNCRRKTKPAYNETICDDNCHDYETETDECGFHKKVCKCRYPPLCHPTEPPPIDCHNITNVPLGYYGCANGTNECKECHQYRYDLFVPENNFFKCKPCEIEKMKDLPCGAFETKCECRKPINCNPSRPENITCHTLEKVYSTDPDNSMCGADGKCEPCYSWKYVAEEYTVITKTCDDRCQFKVPKSTECGSNEECRCVGKTKVQCQPVEPPTHTCYNVSKVLIDDSYMCDEEGSSDTCAQCFGWEFTEKGCPVPPDPECKPKCQTEISVHTECNCYDRQCRSTVMEDCRPPKPSVDLECYTDPVEEYRDGVFSYDSNRDVCDRCYKWKYEHKKFPAVDTCVLRTLPAKCFTDYTEAGKCGTLVTECRRNHLKSAELYSDENECPNKHKKVSLKSTCGDPRDACVDCEAEDFAERRWSDTYDNDCYDIKDLRVMGTCTVPIKKKKKCQYEGKLTTTECQIKGQKRRIFYDKCGCPSLVCAGCPEDVAVDLQLILDSSGSITESGWTSLIEFLKIGFVDSIFGNTNSRLAVAKYGTETKIIQKLHGPVSPNWLDTDEYNWEDLVNTNTGKAIDATFPDYQAETNGTSANKVLVVLTDGEPSESDTPVSEAIKQWNAWGVKVIAVGFSSGAAPPKLTGLQEISKDHAYLLDNLADAERGLATKVVPLICGQPRIILDNNENS